jgi:hypothetical protein
MNKVRFIYESDDYEVRREIIATKICEFLRNHLDLPEEIQIVFAKLPMSEYGETIVNPRFKNRIKINNILNYKEIAQVLIHELIHLQQIKTGQLSNTSNGLYIWNKRIYNILENTDYDSLPWEQDVVNIQHSLLPKLNEYLRTTLKI